MLNFSQHKLSPYLEASPNRFTRWGGIAKLLET